MKDLLFSIITPSYNQGHYLEDTIVSVINQGFERLEHIIIDGSSKDNSLDIIKKHSGFLHYWVSEPDKGQSHAINKGIAHSNGDIIAWINSDDQLIPDALKTVNNYFQEKPDCHILVGQCMIANHKSVLKITNIGPNHSLTESLAGMAYAQPSVFFRKSLLTRTGLLDESLHYAMDYDLFARFALIHEFDYLPHVLSKYLIHNGSKTNNHLQKFSEEWALVYNRVLLTLGATEQLDF